MMSSRISSGKEATLLTFGFRNVFVVFEVICCGNFGLEVSEFSTDVLDFRVSSRTLGGGLGNASDFLVRRAPDNKRISVPYPRLYLHESLAKSLPLKSSVSIDNVKASRPSVGKAVYNRQASVGSISLENCGWRHVLARMFLQGIKRWKRRWTLEPCNSRRIIKTQISRKACCLAACRIDTAATGAE